MKISKIFKDNNEFSKLCNSNVLLVAESKFIKQKFSLPIGDDCNIAVAEKYLALTVIHNIAKKLANQRLLNYYHSSNDNNKINVVANINSTLDHIFDYKQKLRFPEYVYYFLNIIEYFYSIYPPNSSRLQCSFNKKIEYLISVLNTYFDKEMQSAKYKKNYN